jgi:taurine dioxygenase
MSQRPSFSSICPITGALGVEIAEIDLSADLDDGTVAASRRAWLDHLVIFFRGQNLPSERFTPSPGISAGSSNIRPSTGSRASL